MEQTLITDASLNTAAAKHAGALLLAHLRAIKQASGNAANFELDQANNYVAGPANGDPFSWLAKDQDAINAILVNRLNANQFQALREYSQAHNNNNASIQGRA